MPYIANTEDDRKEMLEIIGCKSIDDLFEKSGIKSKNNIDFKYLGSGLSELEVTEHIKNLAKKNREDLVPFIGGGFYDHHIPAVVPEFIRRGEFLTAYTPYQPEASQGTLQAIFEYQTAICRILDMDVSNASLYDGGTALFEAITLAMRISRRKKVLVDKTVSPIYRNIIKTHTKNLNIELVEIEGTGLKANRESIISEIDNKTACIILQYPNFFGVIEDFQEIVSVAHKNRAIAICSTYPIALGILKTPGSMDFDIVTAEGQSLGMPLNFGGPYLGIMAVKKQYMRKMPGRICGQTKDMDGNRAFVLTLQAREQHIRRDKAMSNICSNENLSALSALIYLSAIGKKGFKHISELCAAKALYARDKFATIENVEIVDKNLPFFNEFVIKLPINAEIVVNRMLSKGYIAGFPIGIFYPNRGKELLISVTEKRSREEIDNFVQAFQEVL